LADALASLRTPPPGQTAPPAVAASPAPFTDEPAGAPATSGLFDPLSLRAAAVPTAVAEATPGFPLRVASQDFAALIEGAGRNQAAADQIAGAFLNASALI